MALTGAQGAFGSAMREQLERAGATVWPLRYGTDWTYAALEPCDDRLRRADVLVLAHGSKVAQAMEANCTSFIGLLERYRALRAAQHERAEVWAVGSEIELHSAFGNADLATYLASKRAYARHAARLYREQDAAFVYRHIVPSAFASRMGWGPMSARTAARLALFFIGRDWRYVPVTWTGLALLNYFRFRSLT